MKIIVQSIVAVTAVCLLAGCETTGLSPRETAGVSYPNYILSLQTGDGNTPEKVSTPIRLAVAQVGEAAPPEAMLDKLAKEKTLVASVTALPLPGDTGSPFYGYGPNAQKMDYAARVKTICGLARISGADFLFLFGGNVDSWQENNPLSVLDITIVGGALVPGTRIHIEGKGAGVLISTATCRPVLFVNSEAKDSEVSPDLLVNGKTTALCVKVRDELVAKLTDQFVDKLGQLSNQ